MANDSDITERQIAEWIGPYSLPPERVPPPPGTCPKCKMDIDAKDVFEAGAWSGYSGTAFAAGPMFGVECANCGVGLRAYHNVYNQQGEIPDEPVPIGLIWGLANNNSES